MTLTPDADRLATTYIQWGILPARSIDDARHVAAATAARADAIVSWNFRDIVELRHMRAFNAVNLSLGYGLLPILSPMGIDRADEEPRT